MVTQTVGFYVDGDGNQIWICPQCKKPDDGSPMIGCDECDDWYHWVCELRRVSHFFSNLAFISHNTQNHKVCTSVAPFDK